MSGVLRVQYRVENKERLFDVGQTVYANRRRIMKKSGIQLRAYTKTLERMRAQGTCFLALALLQAVLMRLSEPDALGITLLVLILLCAVMLPLVRRAACKSYQKALQMYLTDNGEVGYLLFDEEGITDYSEKGNRTVLPWKEYSACVMTEEAIVLLFERPVLLILGHEAQTERDIRGALAAFGRADIVQEAKVKESVK